MPSFDQTPDKPEGFGFKVLWFKEGRYRVQALGLAHLPRRSAPPRWRSHDLEGPLPAPLVHNLVTAVQSPQTHGPWPEIDEEASWKDVLTDRRLRLPSEKKLYEKGENTRFRLDRLPCKSLTFPCKILSSGGTLTIAELIKTFGPDRNVKTIGRDVIRCRDKRARREGNEWPINYRA